MGQISTEEVESRDRGQPTDKKTGADLDTENKLSRLQLQQTNSPFGDKIRDTTSDANRVMQGIQKFGTISKVAGVVVLGQSLVDGECCSAGDSQRRKESTRG